LARGFLAGNRRAKGEGTTKRARSDGFAHSMYYEEGDFAVLEQVEQLAQQREVTAAQIALAWLMQKPGVSCPIIGASKMFQLEEAVAATEIQLTEEEMKRIEAPYRPHPILGHG